MLNPKRLFNWGDTIYVSYCDYLDGTSTINKPRFSKIRGWHCKQNYRLRLGNPGVSSFNWWQPRRQCRNQHFLGTPSHRCSLLFVQICFQSKHGQSNFVGANKQIFLQHNSSKIISKPNQFVPASMIRKPLCFFEINKGQICLSLGENIADPRGSTWDSPGIVYSLQMRKKRLNFWDTWNSGDVWPHGESKIRGIYRIYDIIHIYICVYVWI